MSSIGVNITLEGINGILDLHSFDETVAYLLLMKA